jgi:hypothetical protein
MKLRRKKKKKKKKKKKEERRKKKKEEKEEKEERRKMTVSNTNLVCLQVLHKKLQLLVCIQICLLRSMQPNQFILNICICK